ncbi:efflux RND transporter periplasmic adaptor subunit [Tianweitania sediminis]|jgi:multidrug efflux system membrane fusion protein|uniref:Efflux RND transporter periplasmic adaptor subunit n=1 Tax=Tianweitania sediminis TaxID=1502156 RepID=A0A8J7R545_9HYPH|nr:efflux RND transporter periplasmic adaptor subunit [Tianweitania sediminis]MBP0437772.1 efflux RND transporter periplasmic adaptor subunit [Tianweitania sediminis]HEV7416682.1 efflux RND transporter periplasmic adaptor subunit [Tianweitania sediminis]
MAKFRFHKVAAVAVLIGTAAWMGTGKFSSVGSAAQEAPAAAAPAAGTPEAAPAPEAVARTVAYVVPPRRMHARAIRMSGVTEANKRAILATRAGGIIDELPVQQGQRVETGDLILRLAAEEKAAAVETARAVFTQRQAENKASESLAKSGNLARLQIDASRAALAQARSQLEAAEAELARDAVLAPFNGVVDKIDVELGSSVIQGGQVATLLNLDPILAVGEVSERELGFLEVGSEADVRLINGMQVEGTVRYISREASAQTRTFRIEVAVPNSKGEIPAGMTAEITLRAAPVDAVFLPRSVVTLSVDGEIGVRSLDPSDKVVFIPIDLVDDTPEGLVLAGIPKDTRIIVAGQDLVSNGDLVKPVEADMATLRTLAGEATGG